jgi:hypothetical protein
VPDEADELPPEGAEHLWEWFVELASGRQAAGFGACALSWVDMAAWAALNGHMPSPWEFAVLRRLDGVYLEVSAASNTPERRNTNDRPSNIRVRR